MASPLLTPKGTTFDGAANQLGQAPPLKEYPSAEDAALARRAGFSYGSGSERFLSGDRIRDAGKPRGDIDTIAKRLAGTPPRNVAPKQKGDVSDLFTKAALAANRSAITSLGFDPARINVERTGEQTTIAGFYADRPDQVYANASVPAAMVHESAHRGLKILRDAKVLTEKERNLLDDHEEFVVRYLMQKTAGDPEATQTTGDVSKKQQEIARYLFGQSALAQERRDTLASIERKAAALVAQRRMYGPR